MSENDTNFMRCIYFNFFGACDIRCDENKLLETGCVEKLGKKCKNKKIHEPQEKEGFIWPF